MRDDGEVKKAVSCNELAKQIGQFLRQFEADPQINCYKDVARKGSRSYFCAGAWASGKWVYVRYVSYQGDNHLTKSQAEQYLRWLQAGNVGYHWKAIACPRCEAPTEHTHSSMCIERLITK